LGIFINIISGMKIAIAFFGIPRCSKKSYPSIKEQIIEHLPPGAKTKCFYHFYEQKEVVNARSGEEGELDQTNYVYFEKFAGILEKPDDAFKKTPFEKAKKFGNAWSRDIEDFSTLRNLLLQLRSLKKVTKLVESFEPDCVFFVRPDLLYHEPIPDYYYNLSKNSINSIFVPGWQWGAGINDRFAIANKDSYQVYGYRIDEAMNYCKTSNHSLHSERLLKWVLLKKKVKIFILQATASRVRINGEIIKENFGTRTSFLSALTNRRKRFLYHAQWKTRLKIFFS
jgi:hypothetical protein|tara:strand:+ start:4888 stop:5736 length:849 start_codon:yes stop_codon:yes gene_type:complete